MATQNNLFVLFAASDAAAVNARLAATDLPFTILAQPVSTEDWFLITRSAITTKEVSDALGISDGTNGGGILVRVENYYGRASTAIWEWVVAKRGIALDSATE